MKQAKKPPVLDVILAKTLPTRCPGCGREGAPVTDGRWPAKTVVACPFACGWAARYQQREPA